MTTPPKRKMHRRNAEQRRRWSQAANAAKARKRMAAPSPESEPKMAPWNRFLITVTDRQTGDAHTFEFSSIRNLAKRLSVLTTYYASPTT